MPPRILSRLSKSFRQQQKKIACHYDSKRQSEGVGETCPICWKTLPKKPQCLPCGHEFCKGCIVDLRDHAKSTHQTPKCPVCRGPLEQESFKKLYKRACHHEHIGSTLIGLGAATTSFYSSSTTSDFAFLSNEVIREYGLAANNLEECLVLLENTEQDPKLAHYRLSTLLKLQEVLKYHVLPESQYKKRISLLKEAILISTKPLAQAHLEMGKIFVLLEDGSQEFSDLAISQFETILKLAEQSRLTNGTKKARQLRGKAHFQIGLVHQANGRFAQAAHHYDLAHRYKACVVYRMPAKCHSLAGNLPKAIHYAKMAVHDELEMTKCETHLTLLNVYEKLFLVEQLNGVLVDHKHYKYHADIELYCSSLIQAKQLASSSQERAEVFLRMDTFAGLIPWKLSKIQEYFPKKSYLPNNLAPTRGTSPSEITYEMGEMEDSLYSNSLYSNSFDCANDDEEDEDEQDHSESSSSEEEDGQSELSVSDDDGTGNQWTDNQDHEEVLSLKSMEEEEASCHDFNGDDCSDHEDDASEELSMDHFQMQDYDYVNEEGPVDNLKMQDDYDSEPEDTAETSVDSEEPPEAEIETEHCIDEASAASVQSDHDTADNEVEYATAKSDHDSADEEDHDNDEASLDNHHEPAH